MKNITVYGYKYIFIIILTLFTVNTISSFTLSAQDKSVESKITKNDGAIYIGVILSNDEKGVLIETKDLGKILIPKHEIKSIGIYDGSRTSSSSGSSLNDLYSTRYFLTTNGLPIEKGDEYLMLAWYGAEAHFAVSDNLSVGVMTTWFAIPVIGSVKYSINLTENLNLGLGALVGSGSWLAPAAFGGLGYGSLTLGNRSSNLSLSAGYAYVNSGKADSGHAPLMSIAGMAPIAKKVSFVFDSFIYLNNQDTWAILIPGLRFATSEKNSFQFGFGGYVSKNDTWPVPFLSWLRVIE
jgi:hypothetical protein